MMLAQDQRAYSAEQAIMRDIWHSAPYAPHCSNDKRVGLQLPRKEAFSKKYVQLNPPCNIKFFVIDIDHEDTLLWNNDSAPAPNAIIRNKDNKKCHLLYRVDDILVKSVKEDVKVKDKPLNYATAVYYGLCKKFKADRAAFSNVVSKNPFHPDFDTEFLHERVYTLKQLAEYAEPDWSVYRWGEKENPNPESRHLCLFHKLRHIAYRHVNKWRLSGDSEGFYHFVLAEGLAMNQFTGKGFKEDANLAVSSVKATAKSITEWTWNKYHGTSCNRGVMKLPHDMALKEKQRKAARYAADIKHERTLKLLVECFQALGTKDNKPTQAKVALKSGISVSSVKRYWAEVLLSVDDNNAKAAAIKEKNVSLGIHKVSFPRSVSNQSPVFAFKYELSSFVLNKHRSLLNLDASFFLSESVSLSANYHYSHASGRVIESSLVNVQTLNKSTRQDLFKGWYEIDLKFSHGQMFVNVVSEHLLKLQAKQGLLSQSWSQLEIESWFQLLDNYQFFITNMDLYFGEWSDLTSLSIKQLKVALVAYLHGAGKLKFNSLLDDQFTLLLSNARFKQTFNFISLCRKSISGLSLKLRTIESNVFKPYWGKALIIHDALLLNDPRLAARISDQLKFEHTVKII